MNRRWVPVHGLSNSLQQLVPALPMRELAPLALAIAFLFALLGPVMDVFSGGRQPLSVTLTYAGFSAAIAIGYAFGTLRRRPILFFGTVTMQIVWVVLTRRGVIGRYTSVAPEHAGDQLWFDGSLILALMIASYACFLWFINGAAARYLRVRAEMDLAHQIHQVLVPVIDARIGGFEFFGRSQPSGDVGGDLVDMVGDREWFAYVADVSGHGVSSGLVMGMFKSAMRMRLRERGPLSALLTDLNGVLFPLKSGSMFVTLACVRFDRGGALEYAVAGHLPILRVRDGRVEEITTPQVPIAMFDSYPFTSSTIDVRPGDLLALITDGLIEVFDAQDRELGLDRAKALLAASAGRPLAEIADGLVSAARAHGRQLDDQTLLLVRHAETIHHGSSS